GHSLRSGSVRMEEDEDPEQRTDDDQHGALGRSDPPQQCQHDEADREAAGCELPRTEPGTEPYPEKSAQYTEHEVEDQWTDDRGQAALMEQGGDDHGQCESDGVVLHRLQCADGRGEYGPRAVTPIEEPGELTQPGRGRPGRWRGIVDDHGEAVGILQDGGGLVQIPALRGPRGRFVHVALAYHH